MADLDPRAEIAFWWGFFGSNFAQMAPGGAESDFGLQGWITLGLEQIFLIFSAPISLQIQLGWEKNVASFTNVIGKVF